jgi:hypothetical protein
MHSIHVSKAVRASLRALAGTALAVHAPLSPAQQASGAASADSGQLEEILITAQKRTEKLEDVPVAASVVSAEVCWRSRTSATSPMLISWFPLCS